VDILQAIVLGIVQGTTEFLPVSSSGHLVLLEKVWNINDGVLFFNVLLHVATLLAVVLFYRKKIWELIKNPFCKTNLYLVLATLPTIIIVVLFNSFFESTFSGGLLVLGFLLTAVFLLITEKISRYYERTSYSYSRVDAKKSILLGVMQGLAVMPGLSRSGTTVCASIVMGIDKKDAIDFSFLMSIPIIIASLVYELMGANFSTLFVDIDIMAMALGSIFAFIFAILGIKVMLKVVEKVQYYWFAIYLVGLSVVTLLV